MNFYVHRNGQQMGPYSPEEVRSYLSAGRLQINDLAWQEGTANWQPLSSFADFRAGAPPPIPASSPLPFPPSPQTSGLAVASLVLGILSFVTVGLTGLPAVICGHLASSSIKKSGGRMVGGGLALGGLITGYIGFLFIFLGILAGIALPVFNAVQDRGAAVKGLSQAKQIALGCKLYAVDHNGKFPDTLDDLVPTYLSDRHLFICPLDREHNPLGYNYYGGADSDPAQRVLLASKATTMRHQRIVVHVDCSSELERE